MVSKKALLLLGTLFQNFEQGSSWSSSTQSTFSNRLIKTNDSINIGFQSLQGNRNGSHSSSELKSLPIADLTDGLSSSMTTIATSGTEVLFSALSAYGHYFSVMLMTACLITERLTIKAAMSQEEESTLAIADAIYGMAGILLVVSGYYRISYEKSWDFYSHEPIFWLKLVLVSVVGACSFFPTTKIIQRAVAQRNGKFEPMSAKLAARMTTIMNAELLAIFSIPAFATLMSRGVGYNDSIPWQIEAAFVPIILFGLGGKYIKEALDWKEEEASTNNEVIVQ